MVGYRSSVPSCPRCGEFLEEREARGIMVDVCPECSGLWIDWFDGELSTVATHTGPLPTGQATTQRGSGSCPRCRVPLIESHYGDGGPTIMRCGECAGAFVARQELDLLVTLGPPESLAEKTPATAWEKLVTKLRSWLQG